MATAEVLLTGEAVALTELPPDGEAGALLAGALLGGVLGVAGGVVGGAGVVGAEQVASLAGIETVWLSIAPGTFTVAVQLPLVSHGTLLNTAWPGVFALPTTVWVAPIWVPP